MDTRKILTRGPLFFVVITICVLWSIPTFGVLISSFRSERDINTTGWWQVINPVRENPAYANLRDDVEGAQRPIEIASGQLASAQPLLEEARGNLPAAAEDLNNVLDTVAANLDGATVSEDGQDALADATSAIEEARTLDTTLTDAQTALADAQAALEAAGGPDALITTTQTSLITAGEALANVDTALEIQASLDQIDAAVASASTALQSFEAGAPFAERLDEIATSLQGASADEVQNLLEEALAVVANAELTLDSVDNSINSLQSAATTLQENPPADDLSANLDDALNAVNAARSVLSGVEGETAQAYVDALSANSEALLDASLSASVSPIEDALGTIDDARTDSEIDVDTATLDESFATLTTVLADAELLVPLDRAQGALDNAITNLEDVAGAGDFTTALNEAKDRLNDVYGDNALRAELSEVQAALSEAQTTLSAVAAPDAVLGDLGAANDDLQEVPTDETIQAELVTAADYIREAEIVSAAGIYGAEDVQRSIENAQGVLSGIAGTGESQTALTAAAEALAPLVAVGTAQEAVVDAYDDRADAVEDLSGALNGLADAGTDTADDLAVVNPLATFLTAESEVATIENRLATNQANLAADQYRLDTSGEAENIVFGSAEWRAQWTLDNYDAVLNAENMGTAFVNSLLVTIPSVVIPITIAAFAAYAFAWMEFPGRNVFFALVVVLMVVPLHTALIPILTLYVNVDLNGTYLGIWLAHTGFGMPLAIYLLYGYISTIPKEIMESAHVDGASPFTTFTRLVLPLSVPAVASFAIFQFLWVWNDLLVALVFLGTEEENRVLTRELSELVGSKGQDWEVLTAGAFISMIVPLFIFLALQRYFVRGMMAGSVKG